MGVLTLYQSFCTFLIFAVTQAIPGNYTYYGIQQIPLYMFMRFLNDLKILKPYILFKYIIIWGIKWAILDTISPEAVVLTMIYVWFSIKIDCMYLRFLCNCKSNPERVEWLKQNEPLAYYYINHSVRVFWVVHIYTTILIIILA